MKIKFLKLCLNMDLFIILENEIILINKKLLDILKMGADYSDEDYMNVQANNEKK